MSGRKRWSVPPAQCHEASPLNMPKQLSGRCSCRNKPFRDLLIIQVVTAVRNVGSSATDRSLGAKNACAKDWSVQGMAFAIDSTTALLLEADLQVTLFRSRIALRPRRDMGSNLHRFFSGRMGQQLRSATQTARG